MESADQGRSHELLAFVMESAEPTADLLMLYSVTGQRNLVAVGVRQLRRELRRVSRSALEARLRR